MEGRDRPLKIILNRTLCLIISLAKPILISLRFSNPKTKALSTKNLFISSRSNPKIKVKANLSKATKTKAFV